MDVIINSNYSQHSMIRCNIFSITDEIKKELEFKTLTKNSSINSINWFYTPLLIRDRKIEGIGDL